MNRDTVIISLFLLALVSGCRVYQPVIAESGYYSVNPDIDLGSISSITIVTPTNDTRFPLINRTLGKILCNTIIKKHLFQVNYINSDDRFWNQVNAITDYTDKDSLKRYRSLLRTDALMIGEVTDYKPFPSVVIGLKLKIYDLRTGQLAWTLQQLWDSKDKGVENRIKRYFARNIKTGYEPLNWQYIRTSPNAYQQFVCFEVASTLPSKTFYRPEYIKYRRSNQSIRDKALRPVIHFPAKVKKVIGLK